MVGGIILYIFSSEYSKSTMSEHISLFLAQMGEASTLDFMIIVHNFPLSLMGQLSIGLCLYLVVLLVLGFN